MKNEEIKIITKIQRKARYSDTATTENNIKND